MGRNFMQMLREKWAQKKSVCIGLDSELGKIPQCVRELAGNGCGAQAMAIFNHAIVEATYDIVGAYKPNTAFYEALGSVGWEALQRTNRHIHQVAPDVPVIVDGKRTDIGNTNAGYAKGLFDFLEADAITVHPYLGEEALRPFLDLPDKGIIVLCRTSNPGAGEFQDLMVQADFEEILYMDKVGAWKRTNANDYAVPLYLHVAYRVSRHWNKNGNCAIVVGATYLEELRQVRAVVGDMPILIPGIGAQGGDVEKTVNAGKDGHGHGMIINSSRGIIFVSKDNDFAQAARREAEKLDNLINQYR